MGCGLVRNEGQGEVYPKRGYAYFGQLFLLFRGKVEIFPAGQIFSSGKEDGLEPFGARVIQSLDSQSNDCTDVRTVGAAPPFGPRATFNVRFN
jgi:hypothetical protein